MNKLMKLNIERMKALILKNETFDNYLKDMNLDNYKKMQDSNEFYHSFQRKIYTHEIIKELVLLFERNETVKELVYDETENYILKVIKGSGIPYFKIKIKDEIIKS